MQRILATLLILAGLGGIGYGVATATVLRESDTVVATATPSGDGTMVVTEPGVLGLVDDQVTVRATVPEGQKVTLALGSDVDVLGWVGDDPYDSVTGLSSWEALSVAPGAGAATEGEETDGEETDAAPAEKPGTGPDPAGSDMWISEVSGETAVSMRWTEEPGRVVLLAAGVGKGAEAPTLELTWPRPVNTPYLWPGVLGGGFLLILGIFMAIGARRNKKRGNKGRTPSAVRTRQPDSELPRRDAVFAVDGEQSSPSGHEPGGGLPPALGDPVEGGTAVFPPSGPALPGRGQPAQSAPEPDQTQVQLEDLVADLTDYEVDGRPALQNTATLVRLGEIAVRINYLELLCKRSISAMLHDGSQSTSALGSASLAKSVWAELGQDIAALAFDILGPQSTSDRWSEHRLSSRSLTIAGGTTQINKGVTAARVLGLPRR